MKSCSRCGYWKNAGALPEELREPLYALYDQRCAEEGVDG